MANENGLDLGMGTSPARATTPARLSGGAGRARRNSVSFAEAFGFEKSDMLIDVEIAQLDEVDRDEVKAVLSTAR